MIFSGKPAYTTRKLRDLQSRGWVIVKEKKWADGSSTFVMEYVGKK
jgi:hypothetical protein